MLTLTTPDTLIYVCSPFCYPLNQKPLNTLRKNRRPVFTPILSKSKIALPPEANTDIGHKPIVGNIILWHLQWSHTLQGPPYHLLGVLSSCFSGEHYLTMMVLSGAVPPRRACRSTNEPKHPQNTSGPATATTSIIATNQQNHPKKRTKGMPPLAVERKACCKLPIVRLRYVLCLELRRRRWCRGKY